MLIIRELKQIEYYLLKEFVYQSIFQRDETNPIPRTALDDPKIKAYYENFGRDGDYCIVAFLNDNPIGCVWTRIIIGDITGFGNIDETTPEFGISLLKEHRGQGIGTRLMESMLTLLRSKGYKRTSLAVQKDNYAIKMYQNIGFKIIKEMDEEYLMLYDL